MGFNIVANDIEEYCINHSSAEHPVLADLTRQTHLQFLSPRMVSGHLQGRVLSLISKLFKPTRILEIGCYTGYSAICLAEGLTENGKLISLDVNPEIEAFANSYFEKAGFANQIELVITDAKEYIANTTEDYDLVFIDADKRNYQTYYDLLIDKMKPGSILIADNVLWSGKIIEDKARDADTLALRAFNEYVTKDPRVENVLLPIRDGLMILRVK